MNILQKLVDAQLQLQSTQRNWDEECLFKCNDLLGEVIRELENAEQNMHPTVGIQSPSEPLLPLKEGTGIEYLSTQPHSG